MQEVRTISRKPPCLKWVWSGSSETIRRAPLPRGLIIAYLQGALHDASLNKRKRFRFTQKGDAWLIRLQLLFEMLNKRAWIYKEGRDREVYTLETLAPFLDFSFNPSRLYSKEKQCAYLRGFFDAEGGTPKNLNDRFYVQLVQKDKEKLEKLKLILKKLEISTGKIHNPSKQVDPHYWRMFVSADSLQTFVQQVGSWHPRKANIFEQRMMI